MNRPHIRVSVIMTCYNSATYLEEAVKSVLNQTIGDLELILIDDGSTDNTLEIARHYQNQDGRVSLLALPENSGPASARNCGIKVSRGEWIGILDSDDIAMPSRFEKQLELAESDKGLVMIGSSTIIIDENGFVIKEYKYPTKHHGLSTRLYSQRAFPPHSSMLYKKDIFKNLPVFNPRFVPAEDYDLWLRLSEIGKIASVDQPLVKLRKHNHNISNSGGGILQPKYGFIALVCHFLRLHNFPDPATGYDEAAWQEYVEWVDRQMVKEGVFKRIKNWSSARGAFYSSENRLAGAFRFVSNLFQSGSVMEIIREKFFRSSLPEHLASEWMKMKFGMLPK
jgi:glycosyltransferase involved in cell wall biosynthesis